MGDNNPADILTKHLAAEPRERHAARCSLIFLDGRAEIAPQVCADELGLVEISRAEAVNLRNVARRPSGKGIGSSMAPRVSWADMSESVAE